MKKKGNDISELDRELSSFFDGELSPEELAAFEGRLEKDPSLQAELQAYSLVRSELRDSVTDAMRDELGVRRGVDLWNRISEEIAADKPAAPVSKPIAGWLQNFVSGSSWGMPQFGAAFAAVLVLFLYVGTSSDESDSSTALRNAQPGQMALRVPEPVSENSNGDSENVLHSRDTQRVPAPSFGDQARIPLVRMTSGQRTRNARKLRWSSPRTHGTTPIRPFERVVELELGDEQWIGSDTMPGGLRANGVEIEWVRTDRSFRIFTDPEQGTPVIWIGEDDREE